VRALVCVCVCVVILVYSVGDGGGVREGGTADWPRCVLFFSRALPPPTKRRRPARDHFCLYFFALFAWDTRLPGFLASRCSSFSSLLQSYFDCGTFLVLLLSKLYTTEICIILSADNDIKKYYNLVNDNVCLRFVYLLSYPNFVICHEIIYVTAMRDIFPEMISSLQSGGAGYQRHATRYSWHVAIQTVRLYGSTAIYNN